MFLGLETIWKDAANSDCRWSNRFETTNGKRGQGLVIVSLISQACGDYQPSPAIDSQFQNGFHEGTGSLLLSRSLEDFGFLCEADGRKTGSKTGSIGSWWSTFRKVNRCLISQTFQVSDPRKPLPYKRKKPPEMGGF